MAQGPRLWKVVRACLTLCLVRHTVAMVPRLPLATDIPASIDIFSRDTSCGGDSGYQPCGQHLPSDWCCSTSSICIPLNNTETNTVICCPKSDDGRCTTLQPISCDISKQNASINPHSQLFAQDLSRKLETCGQDTCCPLGYSCNGNSCVMNDETKQSPRRKAPTTQASSAPSASSTSPELSTSTTPSAVSATPSFAIPDTPSTSKPTPQSSSDYPARAVLAGLFPGIILGALLCALIFFFLRRRSARKLADTSDQESFVDAGPGPGPGPPPPPKPPMRQHNTRSHRFQRRTISDPIYNPQMSNRTHFLKQPRGSDETSNSSAGKMLQPVTPQRNRWYNSPKLPMGTWTPTVVPTLATPSPQRHRENKVALQELTPTPAGRLNPQPHAPGLAVTTPSIGSVRDFLRPVEDSVHSLKSFHKRTQSDRQANPDPPPRPSPNPARNNSNKSATTIASRSTSGKNVSRRLTAASGETINFLLAPSSSSPTVPLGLGSDIKYHEEGRPPSKISEEGPSATLASPWMYPHMSVPESPIGPDRDKENEQRMTTFTTLMLDAGYVHGSPRKAVSRT